MCGLVCGRVANAGQSVTSAIIVNLLHHAREFFRSMRHPVCLIMAWCVSVTAELTLFRCLFISTQYSKVYVHVFREKKKKKNEPKEYPVLVLQLVLLLYFCTILFRKGRARALLKV